jgi:hypothetical protein
MTSAKVRNAELLPSADGSDWRHVRLTRVSMDAAKREATARPKSVTKMSPSRRLEKLRRLRAALEPPRSWLDKK